METFGRIVLERHGEPERAFSLAKAVVTIGRDESNDIVIVDPQVSRAHAQVRWSGDSLVVADLGSANGTWLNGARVDRAPLFAGDAVLLGASTLRVDHAAPGLSATLATTGATEQTASPSDGAPLHISLSRMDLPRLLVHAPERTWEVPLHGDILAIGRDPAADIVLPYLRASRWHAQIERRGGRFVIRDLGSANGTWLGDRRIEAHTLRDGDTVRIGPVHLIFRRGFQRDEWSSMGVSGVGRRTPRVPVVFVPGFMGSELWRGGERVWPNVRQLISDPTAFRLDAAPLEARGIAREVVVVPNLIKLDRYNRVADFLAESLGYERDRDVLEYPYDWRGDVREAAHGLARAIEAWRAPGPVTIVAHSMGCLVARWYVERLGGKKRVGRLVLLGGPHLGAPRAAAFLAPGSRALPVRLLGERLTETLHGFPSLYQLLPWGVAGADQDGRPLDLFADDRWLPEAARPLLREARAFRRSLGTRSSVPAVSIFGYGYKTATRLAVERDEDGGWRGVSFEMAADGDDSVPRASAVLPGSEIHPVRQSHGALYVDNDVKMRLKLELTRDENGVSLDE